MSAAADPVLALLGEYQAILDGLTTEQLSARLTLERELRKVFVLSAASYFEHRVLAALNRLASSMDDRVGTLTRDRAIAFQYHKFFDWETRKLGAFRKMFGETGRLAIDLKKACDPKFQQAIDDFMNIGSTRNGLVHQNFATFVVSDSIDVLRERYVSALSFVDFVDVLLTPST